MFETILATVAVIGVVLGVYRWNSSVASSADQELCWSCGLRDGHKLWCPNR